jgi:hypothetical protein
MNAATVAGWDQLAAEAGRRRVALWCHVREYAARVHATSRRRETPGHVWAALDATTRPPRVRLLLLHDHTQREYAEAASADLWDAVAAVWALVKRSPADAARLQHVVAELQEAGRWLAAWPVHMAAHDRAIGELFETAASVRPNGKG